VGARFRLDDEDPWITIVGIVGDVHHSGLDVPPNPEFYIHRQQMAAGYGAVVVRAADATTAADAARRALREVDADLPIATIASMTERIDRTVDHRRLLATLAGAFGATALLLSALGLYGVVSYTVAQRTREIGVRMALGSGAGRVLQLFLRDGLRLVALGLLLGGALALSLTRFLGTQLYGVRATDLPSFGLAATVLAAVALLAVLVPARRAALLDPVTTLRAE
jgi:ABC-type antimicrobial peptide transport system permease subunit